MSALAASWLWAVFTIIAAAAQTIRNAAQLGLTRSSARQAPLMCDSCLAFRLRSSSLRES